MTRFRVCFCLSKEPENPELRASFANSKRIDAELKRESKHKASEVTIISLGGKDSGKSSFIKFILTLSSLVIPTDELPLYSDPIKNCVLQLLQSLIIETEAQITNSEFKKRISNILMLEEYQISSINFLETDIALFQSLFKQSQKLQADPTAQYYMSKLAQVFNENYIPTEEDVRIFENLTLKVTNSICFEYNNLIFRIYDIDQKGRAKKWTQHFEGVTAIVFCIQLDDYDKQVVNSDDNINVIQNSIEYFSELVSVSWIRDKPIFLIFNMTENFEEKIKTIDFKLHFPEYEGLVTIDGVFQYIKKKFVDEFKLDAKAERLVVLKNVNNSLIIEKVIFESIGELLVQISLRTAGFVTAKKPLYIEKQ